MKSSWSARGRVATTSHVALYLAIALLVNACAAPGPTSSPGPTRSGAAIDQPGIVQPSLDPSAWLRAPNIEQPTGFMTPQSGVVITRGCAPCHPAIDTLMTGVAARPSGLVAVGWILQDFVGSSWRSVDGSTWTLTGGFPTQSLLSAVAANDQRFVAVGLDGKGATAWTSDDGGTWLKTASPAFADTPLRITSITPWRGGFVAAGFKGTEFFSADATTWMSPDGLSWSILRCSLSYVASRNTGSVKMLLRTRPAFLRHSPSLGGADRLNST